MHVCVREIDRERRNPSYLLRAFASCSRWWLQSTKSHREIQSHPVYRSKIAVRTRAGRYQRRIQIRAVYCHVMFKGDKREECQSHEDYDTPRARLKRKISPTFLGDFFFQFLPFCSSRPSVALELNPVAPPMEAAERRPVRPMRFGRRSLFFVFWPRTVLFSIVFLKWILE